MSTRRFLDLFFKRAATVVRQTYGPDAWIDHSGPDFVIRDPVGVLGTGASVRDAMKEADKTMKERKQKEAEKEAAKNDEAAA